MGLKRLQTSTTNKKKRGSGNYSTAQIAPSFMVTKGAGNGKIQTALHEAANERVKYPA